MLISCCVRMTSGGKARQLKDNPVRFVSPWIVALGDGIDAAMVRNPDGHLLVLERPHNGQ